MKPIFPALGRLAIIASTALGIATAANYANYKSYWHGTIDRVQTVDFNILAHTLPTKLSYALLNDNKEELQATLNSNYGLFGLVVTNCTQAEWECPDQQILYMTESNRQWTEKVSLDRLKYHPFDVLRDPPPLITEWGFDHPRDDSMGLTDAKNKGRIIGRVYYIRGVPPSFLEDSVRWLSNPTSLSGTHKYYSLTAALFLTGGVASWILIEAILYRKRVQEREAVLAQAQAQRETAMLRQQNQQRLKQISQLITEREEFAFQLQSYEQEQEQRIQQYTQQIVQLEIQLQQQGQNNGAFLLEQTQAPLLQEIERQEQTIASLKQQIVAQEKGSSQNAQAIDKLKQQLEEATRQRETVRNQLQQNQRVIDELKHQLQQKDKEQSRIADQWRKEVEEMQRKEAEAQKQREKLEQSIKLLQQEKKTLETTIAETDAPGLNPFEQAIVDRPQNSPKGQAGQWLVIPNIDVQPGRGVRQIVDILLISKSLVVVIEAKKYGGTIKAEGDPKLTEWFSYKPGEEGVKIKSIGGNPYKQVCSYTDSVMRRLKGETSANRVAVFNIVVFDKGANVSQVSSVIGGYSRITTLEQLLPVVEDIETAAAFKTRTGKPQRSAQQIRDLIYRLPMRREAS